MNDRAFDAAMDSLEAAHDRHVTAMRIMTGVLLDFGVTPEHAETILGPVDEMEEAQAMLRGSLRLLKATIA